MATFWRRAVLALVSVIAVLQVIHITLLSRLEALKMERIKRNKPLSNRYGRSYIKDYQASDLDADRKEMWNLVRESSILDSSGEFHMINHLLRAESLGMRNHIRKDITLVTQASISRLHNLEAILARWQGLISVGLFTLTEDMPLVIETLLLLRKCSAAVRYNVSFHLVYPLHVPLPPIGATVAPPKPSLASVAEFDCDNISEFMKSVQPNVFNYAHKGVPFPNNLLRNIARRNSLTEFIFVVDIDLIPSNKLRQDFMSFAEEHMLFEDKSKEDKTVFVVPTYEITDEINEDVIPKDKSELLRSIEMMETRPFYFELCWKCHKYTDYEAWQREPPAPKLSVLFEVLWRDPWEPFYVARNTIPFYDERFRQYGFNRISQVCELHLAGYKFSVLNNAFLIHRGLKTANSFHKEKDLELEHNRVLFRQFKSELKDRYPDSTRRCY